jgi:N-acetylglucosaminyldiphosphoundecaprenol N-acetyl-beta-D-mannosaminyltransferase
MRITILGVPLDDFSLAEVLDRVKKGERLFQVFVNIHKLVLFHKDERLSVLQNSKASVFSVDGRWIQFLARLQGFSLKARFGGQEIINQFFDAAESLGYKIYLLGAERSVLEKAKGILAGAFPKACIVGTQDGFFAREEEVIEEINRKQPDILFLALPSPRKELLGYKIFTGVESLRYVAGVGGAFNIIAGGARRAPNWVQQIGFEWLWRVLQEPRRLFMRYFLDGLWLFWLIFKRAFRHG